MQAQRNNSILAIVRYALPAVIVVAGIVVFALDPGGNGFDALIVLTAAGLSTLLLNWLYRVGVSGDEERAVEDAARAYFGEHGRWPDEDGIGEEELLAVMRKA
jgi:hypothetical protein